MKNININEIVVENLKIKIGNNPEKLELFFIGEFDLEYPYIVLDPFFSRVHSEMIRNKIKNVDIITKELIFINSSSIKCLIKWLVEIQKLDQSLRYTLTFIIHNSSVWQHQSFETLKFIAHNTIKLVVVQD